MYVCPVFRRERSDDRKYVCVSQAVVKWGLNMVVFSCYFMVPETPADKNVPFFEVGSCSWGTYWQFRLGRFLIRFLQVIYEGHNRLLIMRKINKFSLYSQL